MMHITADLNNMCQFHVPDIPGEVTRTGECAKGQICKLKSLILFNFVESDIKTSEVNAP